MQTIGDFLSLGANTARELNTAINSAGSQFRGTLQQLNNDLNALLQNIGQTFQNNLNVAINSLDAESQNEILRLQTLISQIDQTLQQDIQVASQAAQAVIRTAALELETVAQNLEDHLKNLIVVGGETGAYLIDRATYDAIPIISIVALAAGALLVIVLVFVKKFPTGIARVIALIIMVGYAALFASMIFVPTLRGYVMSYTGIGLQQRVASIGAAPRIIGIFPQSVIIPLTPEAQVWGSNLNPAGATLVVKVGSQTVQNAPGDNMIVVKVGGLNLPDGSASLQLFYNTTPGPSEPITLIHPSPTPALPDLTISSFTISPSSPTQGGNAHASITVKNQGAGPAGSFVVYWRLTPSSVPLSAPISGLAAGASQTVGLDSSYQQAGAFDTTAIADAQNTVTESNEGNNSQTLHITVQPAVTPTKTPLTEYSGLVDTSGAFGVSCDMRHDFSVGIDIPQGYAWDGDTGNIRIAASGSRAGGNPSLWLVGTPTTSGTTLQLTVHVGIGSQFPPCGTLYVQVSARFVG